MWTLGISAYHGDSSAAILRDGAVVAAVEEERFTRMKHWAGLPLQAVRYCLDEAGIGLGTVGCIAVNRDPNAQMLRKIGYVLRQRSPWDFISDRLKNRGKILGLDESLSAEFGIPADEISPKIHNVEHHLAHAASGFYASPFSESAVLTVDGFGDWTSTLHAHAMGETLRELKRVFFPHSLGLMYTAVTQFLGFDHYGDEYKVMGLAPYGKPTYLEPMRRLVTATDDGGFKLNLDCFLHHLGKVEMTWENGCPSQGRIYSDGIVELLGEPRPAKAELTQRHKDIAASLQARYEELFLGMLGVLHRMTGSDNVCISGGCAMNSVANGTIITDSPFTHAYVPPQPGDGGGAIGAAYYASRTELPTGGSRRPMSAFLGPAFRQDRIAALLDAHRPGWDETFDILRYDDEDELCRAVAGDIAEGKVVGWFQGRMEWGPRALGARSILADPRRADMKDILNLKIKRRESFRPFAPSILRERTGEYFQTEYDVPYMSMVFQIRPEQRERIPAVTHVNGSGRLQTVDRDDNPRYWKLISAFDEITGVPVVLNTSFNENEPIVCTPDEALDCFLRTKMDTLALGETVLRRT